jgi:hypothetical protein
MKYESPRVIEELDIELEREILIGSTLEVDDSISSVETVGQEVVTVDASSFTSKWE